jgi:hemoglobin
VSETPYDRAGGAPAVLRLAAAHHARCLADPLLEHPFSHGGHPDHVQRLADYLGEALGGPPLFSAHCGGQSAMLRLHAGTGAGRDYGDAFVAAFLAAVDDAGLPDDPALRAALRAFITSATDEVVAVSPEGSPVPDDLPVPSFSLPA